MELLRSSNDALRTLKAYCKQLLHLNQSHEPLISISIPYLLDSYKFTCFPHCGSASIDNYVLDNQDHLRYIHRS